MPKNDLVSRIRTKLGLKKRPLRFSHFIDAQGNFEMEYPSDWTFDKDIAVIDGKYTISFESKDRKASFTIAVDSMPGRDFDSHARAELESPSSGIYTPARKGRFREMQAYFREYAYLSSGNRFFGGGVMFYTGSTVFSVSWGAPEAGQKEYGRIFDRMLKSIVVKSTPKHRVKLVALTNEIQET